MNFDLDDDDENHSIFTTTMKTSWREETGTAASVGGPVDDERYSIFMTMTMKTSRLVFVYDGSATG